MLACVADVRLAGSDGVEIDGLQRADLGLDRLAVDLDLQAFLQVGDDVRLRFLQLGLVDLELAGGKPYDLLQARRPDVDGPQDLVLVDLDFRDRELLIVGPDGSPREEREDQDESERARSGVYLSIQATVSRPP